jgi:hypothetical protein
MKLGKLQKQMLDFCQKHPKPHEISNDYVTVRTAKSLQKLGLIHIIDCGVRPTTGKNVLSISLV